MSEGDKVEDTKKEETKEEEKPEMNGKAENGKVEEVSDATAKEGDADGDGDGDGDASGSGEKKEVVKEVAYVPRPNKEEKEEKLAVVETKINDVQKVRAKFEKEMEAIRNKNSPEKKQLDAVRDDLTALNKTRDTLLKERDALRNKLDMLRQAQKARRDEIRKFKEKNRYTKTEEIDNKIKQLVDRQNTVSLSLKEEKKLIKEIEGLKADRKKVEEFKKFLSGDQGTGEGNGESISDALKAKNAEIHQVFEQINVKVTERRRLFEKRDKDGQSYKTVRDKLQKTRDELKVLYDQKKAILKEWKEKNDEWYTYRRAQQEIRKQKEQQQREEDRKRYEELQKKREEEELKKKPWEEEIALCDFLISYLQRLLQEKSAAKEDAEGDKGAANDSTSTVFEGFEDLKLVQKKKDQEDNFMVMGGGRKPKKQSKKKKKEKDGKDVISHSLDLLQSFGLLSLKAPVKVAEIPDSIKDLKEKRAYYDVLPRAPKKTGGSKDSSTSGETSEAGTGTGTGKETKKQKPAKSKKKKVTAPSVESDDLFPVLPGSRSPKAVPVQARTGPTAVDLIKSYDDLNQSSATISPPIAPTQQEVPMDP